MKERKVKLIVFITCMIIIISLLPGCTTSQTTIQNEEKENIIEPVTDKFDFDIERVDMSESENSNGHTLKLKQYYDIVRIKNISDAAEIVNKDITSAYEEFRRNSYENEQIFRNDLDNLSCDDEYINTVSSEVTKNEDGIFCVKYTSESYVGGVFNSDLFGVVYSTETGQKLNIAEALKISEIDAMERVELTVDNAISKEPERFVDNARLIVSEKSVNDINFYLENDEVYICFPTYELAAGSEGCLVFKLETKKESDKSVAKENNVDNKVEEKNMICLTDLLGKNFGEIREALGEDYEADYYEGGFGANYNNLNVFYVLDDFYEDSEINDNMYSGMLISWGTENLAEGITSSMTFPELKQSLSKKIKLFDPELFYNEMEGCYEYSLEFDYSGYNFKYFWYDDPQIAKSDVVWVNKE